MTKALPASARRTSRSVTKPSSPRESPDSREVELVADGGSAFREGLLDALGIPAMVLAAGYIGFGALAASNGLSFAGTLLSTLLIWALPGQLILAEMHTLGAPFFAVLLSVVLS